MSLASFTFRLILAYRRLRYRIELMRHRRQKRNDGQAGSGARSRSCGKFWAVRILHAPIDVDANSAFADGVHQRWARSKRR